jgi:succinoglycan biosynthesis protein ExoA
MLVKLKFNVVIAVPVLNEAGAIEGVVQNLLDSSADLQSCVVVVADGGSHDGTPDIVRNRFGDHERVKLLHNPGKLQSAGVNLCVQEFAHPQGVLIRCDAHSDYQADFITRLLTTLNDTGADSVVVPMDSVGFSCLQKAVAWVSDTPLGSGGAAHRGGHVKGFVDHGHHAAFKVASFIHAGGYDPTFSHNEDGEFDNRLRARGGRIYMDSDIRLKYFPRDSLIKLFRQYFNYGCGRSRTVRRHPGSIRLRQMAVPLHLILLLTSLALLPVSGVFGLWPLTYLFVLTIYSLMITAKRKSACGLLAGPAAFAMHTGWALGFFYGFLAVRERRWIPEDVVTPAVVTESLS